MHCCWVDGKLWRKRKEKKVKEIFMKIKKKENYAVSEMKTVFFFLFFSSIFFGIGKMRKEKFLGYFS